MSYGKNSMICVMVVMAIACTEIQTVTEEVEVPVPVVCATDCDDGDDCTEDVCNSMGECEHFLVPDCVECNEDSDCMDEDPCTLGACEDGACVQNPSTEPECSPECDSHEQCDDGDDCTMDICGFDGQCVREDVCIEGWDLDGDGFAYPEDCDDRRADVHPDAEEICDMIRDNDCDGTVDEDGVCAVAMHCTAPAGHCPFDLTSDQVAIDMMYGNCTTDAIRPQMAAPYTSLDLQIVVGGLNPGDFVEQFVIRQIAGAPELHRALLTVDGYIDGINIQEVLLATAFQDEDGAFRFESFEIPGFDTYYAHFNITVDIPFWYNGMLQLAVQSLDDLVVSGKSTVSWRCGEGMPFETATAFVLCPDQDGDGHDNQDCGGDDIDDLDPTVY